MKTQQAIVSDSGMEAKPVNPYDNLFTGGAYNSGHSKEYWDFNKANPPRPLTKEHIPGAKVTVIDVWQYQFRDSDDWFTTTTTDIEAFEEYADFMYQNFDAATRICFEVLSEEESKEQPVAEKDFDRETQINLAGGFKAHIMPEVDLVGFTQNNVNVGFDITFEQFIKIADQLKPKASVNSVEEAAVNYLIETFMDNDVNPDLLKSIYKSCANHIIQSGAYAKLHDIKTMMEYIEVPANKIEQFEKLFIHLKNKQ